MYGSAAKRQRRREREDREAAAAMMGVSLGELNALMSAVAGEAAIKAAATLGDQPTSSSSAAPVPVDASWAGDNGEGEGEGEGAFNDDGAEAEALLVASLEQTELPLAPPSNYEGSDGSLSDGAYSDASPAEGVHLDEVGADAAALDNNDDHGSATATDQQEDDALDLSSEPPGSSIAAAPSTLATADGITGPAARLNELANKSPLMGAAIRHFLNSHDGREVLSDFFTALRGALTTELISGADAPLRQYAPHVQQQVEARLRKGLGFSNPARSVRRALKMPTPLVEEHVSDVFRGFRGRAQVTRFETLGLAASLLQAVADCVDAPMLRGKFDACDANPSLHSSPLHVAAHAAANAKFGPPADPATQTVGVLLDADQTVRARAQAFYPCKMRLVACTSDSSTANALYPTVCFFPTTRMGVVWEERVGDDEWVERSFAVVAGKKDGGRAITQRILRSIREKVRALILAPLATGEVVYVHLAAPLGLTPVRFYYAGGAADMAERMDALSIIPSLREERMNLVLTYRSSTGGVTMEPRSWRHDLELMSQGDTVAAARGLCAEDRRSSGLFVSDALVFDSPLGYAMMGMDLMHDLQAWTRLDTLVREVLKESGLQGEFNALIADLGVRVLGIATGAVYDRITDIVLDSIPFTIALVRLIRPLADAEPRLLACVAVCIGLLDLVACLTDYAPGLVQARADAAAKQFYAGLYYLAHEYPTICVFTPKLFELGLHAVHLLRVLGPLTHVSASRLEKSHLRTKADGAHASMRADSLQSLLFRDQLCLVSTVAKAAARGRVEEPRLRVRHTLSRRIGLQPMGDGSEHESALRGILAARLAVVLRLVWGYAATEEQASAWAAPVVQRLCAHYELFAAGETLTTKVTYGKDELAERTFRVPVREPLQAVGARASPTSGEEEAGADGCARCANPVCLLHRGVECIDARGRLLTTATFVPLLFIEARRLQVVAPMQAAGGEAGASPTEAYCVALQPHIVVEGRDVWCRVGDFFDLREAADEAPALLVVKADRLRGSRSIYQAKSRQLGPSDEPCAPFIVNFDVSRVVGRI